jgi:UDP-galactopyranose mutase
MGKQQTVLIVGAGFAGATIARILAENNIKVHVIDKREHIAGNAYDYVGHNGVRIHKYGPHIFHTNNHQVFEWVSRFTSWIEYKHVVKSLVEDSTLVDFPPTVDMVTLWGREKILDVFYKPYTQKMWGLPIEKISSDVLDRVKFKTTNDTLYFPNDTYQFMPLNGYHELFQNILTHENITVSLNTQFEKSMEPKYDHVFNSMPIDEYFDFEYGSLPYRSIKFDHRVIEKPLNVTVPVVNFTDHSEFTRMVIWENFPNSRKSPKLTPVTYEIPCDYRDNNHERYYPVKDESGKNRELYNRYLLKTSDKVTFIGRCGLYAYLDMHQAISTSMHIAKNYLMLPK